MGLSVLLALVLLAAWLQQRERVVVPPAVSTDKEVDYYLKDFVITVMDENGRPAQRMTGTSLMHFNDDDSAEVLQPQVTSFASGADAWTLTAPQALIYEGGARAWLPQEVLIERGGVADQAARIETRDAWIYPEREYLETAAAVTITRANGVTRAVGLEIDMAKQQMRLLAEVRGEYVRTDR